MEIDVTERAARASRLAVLDGEEQGRKAEAFRQSGGHDALHALMPSFTGEYQGLLPLTVLSFRQCDSRFQEVAFHELPGAVLFFEES